MPTPQNPSVIDPNLARTIQFHNDQLLAAAQAMADGLVDKDTAMLTIRQHHEQIRNKTKYPLQQGAVSS